MARSKPCSLIIRNSGGGVWPATWSPHPQGKSSPLIIHLYLPIGIMAQRCLPPEPVSHLQQCTIRRTPAATIAQPRTFVITLSHHPTNYVAYSRQQPTNEHLPPRQHRFSFHLSSCFARTQSTRTQPANMDPTSLPSNPPPASRAMGTSLLVLAQSRRTVKPRSSTNMLLDYTR